MSEETGMPHSKITVSARWDDSAGVWMATSGDIADLELSAHSFGELQERLPGALRGLLRRPKSALSRGGSQEGGRGAGPQTEGEGIPVVLRSRQIMTLPA